MMTDNFIREFDRLRVEDVMGICGAAHAGVDAMRDARCAMLDQTVPGMAKKLRAAYGYYVSAGDWTALCNSDVTEPERVDEILPAKRSAARRISGMLAAEGIAPESGEAPGDHSGGTSEDV